MATKDEYAALADQHWGLPIKGKANPYTSMNGNMFSFPQQGRRDMPAAEQGTIRQPIGRPMAGNR
jgi:hypothetical protein